MSPLRVDPSARQRFTAVAVAMVASVGVAACSGSAVSDQQGSAGSDDQIELGATLYATSCASCHGSDLGGTDQGPSHLSIVYEPNHHSDEAFRSAIANGAAQHHWTFGPMPAVPGLAEDEVAAVIAYVRAQQQEQGFDNE